MRTVNLLSWHPESESRAKSLALGGLRIDAAPLIRTSAAIGELAGLNPAALVLDLDRLPSYSREITLTLRASRSARHIPILFAGSLAPDGAEGLPRKYDRLRSEFPDIPYAIWADVAKALNEMLEHPRTSVPIVPARRTYAVSLGQKLGIVLTAARRIKPLRKPATVALLAPPTDFISLLGDLPSEVAFTSRVVPETTLAVCFVRTLAELKGMLDLLVFHLPFGVSAWIAYPKRAASPHLEFNENHVRELALAVGLVDYKICSIDAAWSGMKFTRRKSTKS